MLLRMQEQSVTRRTGLRAAPTTEQCFREKQNILSIVETTDSGGGHTGEAIQRKTEGSFRCLHLFPLSVHAG